LRRTLRITLFFSLLNRLRMRHAAPRIPDRHRFFVDRDRLARFLRVRLLRERFLPLILRFTFRVNFLNRCCIRHAAPRIPDGHRDRVVEARLLRLRLRLRKPLALLPFTFRITLRFNRLNRLRIRHATPRRPRLQFDDDPFTFWPCGFLLLDREREDDLDRLRTDLRRPRPLRELRELRRERERLRRGDRRLFFCIMRNCDNLPPVPICTFRPSLDTPTNLPGYFLFSKRV